MGLLAGYKVSPMAGGTAHSLAISFLIVKRFSIEVEKAANISTA